MMSMTTMHDRWPFHTTVPIIQALMPGSQGAALAVAAMNAGGLGSLRGLVVDATEQSLPYA